MSQLNIKIKKDAKNENVSIEEMRKICDIVWGWQAEGWDDKKVEEMYTLYKQGFFNLK